MKNSKARNSYLNNNAKKQNANISKQNLENSKKSNETKNIFLYLSNTNPSKNYPKNRNEANYNYNNNYVNTYYNNYQNLYLNPTNQESTNNIVYKIFPRQYQMPRDKIFNKNNLFPSAVNIANLKGKERNSKINKNNINISNINNISDNSSNLYQRTNEHFYNNFANKGKGFLMHNQTQNNFYKNNIYNINNINNINNKNYIQDFNHNIFPNINNDFINEKGYLKSATHIKNKNININNNNFDNSDKYSKRRKKRIFSVGYDSNFNNLEKDMFDINNERPKNLRRPEEKLKKGQNQLILERLQMKFIEQLIKDKDKDKDKEAKLHKTSVGFFKSNKMASGSLNKIKASVGCEVNNNNINHTNHGTLNSNNNTGSNNTIFNNTISEKMYKFINTNNINKIEKDFIYSKDSNKNINNTKTNNNELFKKLNKYFNKVLKNRSNEHYQNSKVLFKTNEKFYMKIKKSNDPINNSMDKIFIDSKFINRFNYFNKNHKFSYETNFGKYKSILYNRLNNNKNEFKNNNIKITKNINNKDINSNEFMNNCSKVPFRNIFENPKKNSFNNNDKNDSNNNKNDNHNSNTINYNANNNNNEDKSNVKFSFGVDSNEQNQKNNDYEDNKADLNNNLEKQGFKTTTGFFKMKSVFNDNNKDDDNNKDNDKDNNNKDNDKDKDNNYANNKKNNHEDKDNSENSKESFEKKEKKRNESSKPNSKSNINNIIDKVLENNKRAQAARTGANFFNFGREFMNFNMRGTGKNFYSQKNKDKYYAKEEINNNKNSDNKLNSFKVILMNPLEWRKHEEIWNNIGVINIGINDLEKYMIPPNDTDVLISSYIKLNPNILNFCSYSNVNDSNKKDMKYLYFIIDDNIHNPKLEIKKWKNAYKNVILRWHPDKLYANLNEINFKDEQKKKEIKKKSTIIMNNTNSLYRNIMETLNKIVKNKNYNEDGNE